MSLLSFVVLIESPELARWVRPFETVVVAWLWILSLPIAAICFLVVSGSRSQSGGPILLLCIAAGINAIVWGRGVSWVLRRTLLARFAQAVEEDVHPGPSSDENPPPG